MLPRTVRPVDVYADGLQFSRFLQASLYTAVAPFCASMQAGTVHFSEGTADRQQPAIAPTVPNRVSEGPITEARIHGQWLAGTRPGCHCLHEEAGAPQVITPSVTCCTAWQRYSLLRSTPILLISNELCSKYFGYGIPSWPKSAAQASCPSQLPYPAALAGLP